MSTASDGRRREYIVRNHLVAQGWTAVMRAAASKGPADLLLAHPDHGPALIQVGSRTKQLSPADRERLCAAAELCGALALLAIVVPRAGITYWLVTRAVPSQWERWTA